MTQAQEYLERLREALKEIKQYVTYKEEIIKSLDQIDQQYQQEEFDYHEYEKKLHSILKGQSKQYWIDYYDSCIYTVVNRMEYYNAKLFYEVFNDQRYENLTLAVTAENKHKIKRRHKEHAPSEKIEQKKTERKKKISLGEQIGALGKKIKTWYDNVGTKKPQIISDKGYEEPKKTYLKRKSLFDRIQKARKTGKEEGEKPKSSVRFAPIINFAFIRNLLKKARAQEKVIDKKTDIHQTLKKVRVREETSIDSLKLESKTPQTLLVKEAKQIRKLIQKEEELRIYQPSSLGAIANLTVRKFSLSLIESFPNLFKNLYNSLRLANIQILSNTYVNIMTFFTLVSLATFTFGSVIVYAIIGKPFLLLIINSLAIGFVAAILTFFAFYQYPEIRIKARRKSINANLAFAINHMSATASSGVPPSAMFKLIAQSDEYEQVSVEINKVVDLVEVFGYDLTTAIKAVAATTPSPTLGEFFNGMINNLQSGGDLDHYLKQKSEEAMLSYQLERQKYNETISTYSDIYTGILIAAPLFFVSALSLVSILGGKLMGMEVGTVIGIGTYLVVPLLNIGFLIFLELTQPEI